MKKIRNLRVLAGLTAVCIGLSQAATALAVGTDKVSLPSKSAESSNVVLSVEEIDSAVLFQEIEVGAENTPEFPDVLEVTPESAEIQSSGAPGGGNPEGGNPEGGDPEGGDPEGGAPGGGNPEGGNPEGGDPEGGDPEGGAPGVNLVVFSIGCFGVLPYRQNRTVQGFYTI